MEQQIDSAQEKLIQVILANTSSAIKISKVLCDHSQDKILKADEIICGLIYRLMIPMSDREIMISMNEAEELIYQGSSEEDEEYDEEYDEDNTDIVNDIEDLKEIRKVQTNNCNCNICSQVRVCLCNFKDYIPKDELGDKFKKSILDTCESYNRIF